MNNQFNKTLADNDFIGIFIIFTALFTFAFLSPVTSDRLINKTERFFKVQEDKHPTIIKIIIVLVGIALMIILLYKTISFYLG